MVILLGNEYVFFFLFCIDGVPRRIIAGGQAYANLIVLFRKALCDEVSLPCTIISCLQFM